MDDLVLSNNSMGLVLLLSRFFQRRKVRLRDIKILAQGHTATRVAELSFEPRNYHQNAPCLPWEAIYLVCGSQKGIGGKIPRGLVVLSLPWSVLHFLLQILPQAAEGITGLKHPTT